MQEKPAKATWATGLLLILVGFTLTLRWYVAWLEQYFPWSPLSYYFPRGLGIYLFAILTSPAAPLAVFVEWIWHGWPRQPTWGFFSWLIGYALLIFGRKPASKSEDTFEPEGS